MGLVAKSLRSSVSRSETVSPSFSSWSIQYARLTLSAVPCKDRAIGIGKVRVSRHVQRVCMCNLNFERRGRSVFLATMPLFPRLNVSRFGFSSSFPVRYQFLRRASHYHIAFSGCSTTDPRALFVMSRLLPDTFPPRWRLLPPLC